MIKKRGKYIWLASGMATLALAAIFIFRSGSNASYEGKPLDPYWFRQMSMTTVYPNGIVAWKVDILTLPGQHYGHTLENEAATSNAIVAMGTNCVPFLIGKLGRRDSALGEKAQKWLLKAGITRRFWREAGYERAQAVTTLLILGQNGLLSPDAVKEIRALSQSKDPWVAGSAKCVLTATAGPR